MDKLKNIVAVIAGAGQGIGRAIALSMAREEAMIVVNDYGVDPTGAGSFPGLAEQTAEDIRKQGGKAVSNSASVASWDSAGKINEIEEMENSRPEDVALFVTYLAGAEAAAITEKTFFVGGGHDRFVFRAGKSRYHPSGRRMDS